MSGTGLGGLLGSGCSSDKQTLGLLLAHNLGDSLATQHRLGLRRAQFAQGLQTGIDGVGCVCTAQ
jgi:hypothetical protein